MSAAVTSDKRGLNTWTMVISETTGIMTGLLRSPTIEGRRQQGERAMTRTHDALAALIDRPAIVAAPDLQDERKAVLDRAKVARESGDADLARELGWERAIMNLNVPAQEHYSLFRGGEFEAYAEFYGLTDAAIEYAHERARESSNLLLRVHHLEYVLARGPQAGRDWFSTQRQLAEAYRRLIDATVDQISGEPGRVEGVYVSRWMARLASLVSVRGILRDGEQREWAHWIIEVAAKLRTIQWKRDNGISMDHRWPYEILEHLVAIPSGAIEEGDRAEALDLLQQAYEHYSSEPLADTFASRVAEVDAAVRKHFGETDTHVRMVRRQFEALVRTAKFHRQHGSGLIAQNFFREARKLMETQRQYFDAGEVEELQRLEREALVAAEKGGEFKVMRGGEVTLNLDDFDRRQDTAADTVKLLMALRHSAIPEYAELNAAATKTMRDNPIQFLFGAATVDRGKVVSEARTDDQHHHRVIQQQTALHAELVGLEVVVTLIRAAKGGLLTAADIVQELGLLRLEEEEREILERGIERFLAEDYISAGHILSSQFENAFRRKLTEVGVEPTRFRTLPDGTTRTDEAALGDLMHSVTPDGRTVRELIGEDAWQFIDRTMVAVDGWNLRNKFAHGLAGRRECVPPIVGVILHHILWLATLEVQPRADGSEDAVGEKAADAERETGAAPSDQAPAPE
jgi:hypothetical protein